MSSRESDESDENSQFKISVIMTPGETTENGWRDYSVDLDSGSCGYMDFELYTSAIESLCGYTYFDSVYEDDLSTLESWRNFKEPTLSPIYSIDDGWCIDEIVRDMKGHWQSDGSNSTTDGLNKEHWLEIETQTDQFSAIFCGICVLGNLHTSSGDLGRHSLDRFQKHNRRQKTWSSCRSTRTLISKNSESLKGTGLWFLEHDRYRQWLNQPSSFLWLCGRPGAGKSVLMSTVIRDLEKTRRAGELVVYYFANGYYHGVSTAKAILCSMLGQLLFREPVQNSFREILPLLNDLIAVGNPLSATSMIWLFSKIRHRLRGHETLYLLLDGLEEESHSPEEKELVLELIDHASRHDPNHQIKCFVSSRSTFFGDRLPNGALRVDLDCTTLTRKDMSLYVQDSLHRSMFSCPSRNVQELEEQLLDSASGSFLILRLILEQGRSCPEKSKENFKDFLVNLNDFSEIGLGTIYSGMLARIEDCNKEAALSMMRWVTFAARPLESEELLVLYKQSGIEIKEEDIGNISAGLLVSSGNQIRFTHLSVREYFESQLSDRWEELSEEANEMIAHACLKLLSTENILQSLKLSTNSMLSTKSSMTSGFVPYAQTHWMFHYKRGERRSTYLAGLLHDILEQGFKFSRKNGHTAEDNLKPNTRGTSPEVGYRQIDMERNNFESLNVVNIALGVGARFGFTKLAKLELDMGANINAPSGPEKQTPLCLASKWGHIEVARLLLQRGADPFKASGSGLTPMAYAIANGHYEIRNLLMTYQAKGLLKSGSLGEFGGSQDASQKYRLTIMSSLLCTSCTEFRVVYELCAIPEIWDDTGKVLPPIMVSGETISESELQLFINSPNINSPNAGKASRFSTVVRWYPGMQMYRLLNSVSRRGIDDVRRLLLAAGNEKEDLDMVISVSKLLARSTL